MPIVLGVECYGDLEDDSNFEIMFEDEEDDVTWVSGKLGGSGGVFSSWEDAVSYFLQVFKHKSPIVEITAV